eukprot:GHVP01022258.1.p1 GENE.GHVP01022258.1~~GHVP01022258.1.p1  ORF type:complete len:256 (+),score=32.02 GHVP01022258.1:32-769(+)
MEFKVLSDQLNSAFEVIPTPQGDFQDELLSEPVFRDLSTFRVYNDGKIGFSTKNDVLNEQEDILKVVEGDPLPGYEVQRIRGPNPTNTSEKKNVIGFEYPNSYGKWEIMVCQCGMSEEERREKLNFMERTLEMLRKTCACDTYTVNTVTEAAERELGSWLSKYYIHSCEYLKYFPFDIGSTNPIEAENAFYEAFVNRLNSLGYSQAIEPCGQAHKDRLKKLAKKEENEDSSTQTDFFDEEHSRGL